MSTAIAGKKLSTKPAEPDDRQRARQSKRHPDCRSTTIKLTAHANIACVIVGPRQSSSRRDRRKGHPDCRCVPIQIFALQLGLFGSNQVTAIGSIAVVIGGIVSLGSNVSTFRETMAAMSAAEVFRSDLI